MNTASLKTIFFIALSMVINICRGGDLNQSTTFNNAEYNGGIILIRHGEGAHNINHFYNSRPENSGYQVVQLTKKGREDVQKTAEELVEIGVNGNNVCKVVISPLPRTMETAGIIVAGLKIPSSLQSIDVRAIEQNAGTREGQDYRNYNEVDHWFPENPHSYGGESRDDMSARMQSLVQDIKNDNTCDLNKQFVIIVSHGSPLLLLQEFLNAGSERLHTSDYRIIFSSAS